LLDQALGVEFLGPDFPTGGVIYRYRPDEAGDVIRQAYTTGRGRIVCLAGLAIEDTRGGKADIVVTEQPAAIRQIPETRINVYEADYQAQWADLSDTFREGMMRGIVGFEMSVTRLEGKYKLSQNRSLIDQNTVAQALLESVDPVRQETGQAMAARLDQA
jgi:transcriptional regulator